MYIYINILLTLLRFEINALRRAPPWYGHCVGRLLVGVNEQIIGHW